MIPLRARRAVTISLVVLWGATTACATTYPHLAPVDDEQIRIEIQQGLLEDERIDAESIRVQSHEGVVILAGAVGSTDEARRALSLAGRVPGVQQVVNRLRVVASEAQSPPHERLLPNRWL